MIRRDRIHAHAKGESTSAVTVFIRKKRLAAHSGFTPDLGHYASALCHFTHKFVERLFDNSYKLGKFMKFGECN